MKVQDLSVDVQSHVPCDVKKVWCCGVMLWYVMFYVVVLYVVVFMSIYLCSFLC